MVVDCSTLLFLPRCDIFQCLNFGLVQVIIQSLDKIERLAHPLSVYTELFDYFENIFPNAIKKYEDLFKNNPVDAWKLEIFEHFLNT